MQPTDDLTTRFAYHPPSHTGIARTHEDTRYSCGALAQIFETLLPAGREKALAITKLEEAMFWANAAIARNQGGAE